ncbi:hypothetical protein BABINDRAFT_160520 [Babjeviella inositovora NRRL Y-12698]|uniref:Uncharacterized protein n=1 Tax=Babjeviella inositovora NRRL Y-12698 TaxID=984486 RepID=A0A1E3QTV3_9ASCO|nr:uncharacterized protein BABINDRAFT_160520 [Babjeviella inositovora NRRL Y-12698]ODQ81116.1 hypothetical protein BABINDRAFT_160520 [Babjeviella inositovora NRRL Y-12698]
MRSLVGGEATWPQAGFVFATGNISHGKKKQGSHILYTGQLGVSYRMRLVYSESGKPKQLQALFATSQLLLKKKIFKITGD